MCSLNWDTEVYAVLKGTLRCVLFQGVLKRTLSCILLQGILKIILRCVLFQGVLGNTELFQGVIKEAPRCFRES